jgi:hypothetical protein
MVYWLTMSKGHILGSMLDACIKVIVECVVVLFWPSCRDGAV